MLLNEICYNVQLTSLGSAMKWSTAPAPSSSGRSVGVTVQLSDEELDSLQVTTQSSIVYWSMAILISVINHVLEWEVFVHLVYQISDDFNAITRHDTLCAVL